MCSLSLIFLFAEPGLCLVAAGFDLSVEGPAPVFFCGILDLERSLLPNQSGQCPGE